jgi:CheY-like chemotaxis protein
VIKVNSGDIPLLKKKFSLEKKLSEVILLNKARAFQKGIDLSFDYDPAIPRYLIGDPARIHRIVLELVANALNFTHKGHVKLSAQMAKNNEDNVVLKIIVDDTGIGMPPERQQDIYLQFKRLTASYKGIYKGYGLGLSITKQLIDDLNGEIYVESQLGTGSKFTFIVKLKKALLDEQLGSEDLLHSFTGKNFISPIESESVEDTNKDVLLPYKSHILVVEDSSMAAYIAMNMLSKMHCIVDIAGTGNQAVELAEKKQYDLLFMDIGLPDIDGYEATKRIRLNETNRNHVPIVALTAHASEENKKYCIDIGMNAVLIKPLLQEKAEEFLDFFIPYRKKRLKLKETATVI